MIVAAPTPLTASQRIERAFVACVPVGVLFMFGGLLLAGYIPAVPADWSAREVATFYREEPNQVRLGILLTLVGFMVWGPLVVSITAQMLRARPRQGALAYLQFGAGMASWQFLLVPMLVLAAASFRPERGAEATQTLHDLGWILLFLPFMPFVIQSSAIALTAFVDTSERPVYPRWVGYFNLLEVVLFLPVAMLVFFKSGPFAYHGVLVFWVPLVIFGGWLLVMAWTTYQAVLVHQEAWPGEGTPDDDLVS